MKSLTFTSFLFLYSLSSFACLKVLSYKGEALSDVRVLGSEESFSDQQGCIHVNEKDQHLHLEKEGYASVDLYSYQNNGTVTLFKNPDFPELVKLQGTMGPFTGLRDYDDFIDIGAAFTSFEIQDFFQFSPSQFVSQYKEKIKLFGERDVPSNLFFPTQLESYILRFKLTKERFSSLVPISNKTSLSAMHVRLPVKPLVDFARGNISAVEVASHLQVKNVGVLKNLDARSDQEIPQIPLNIRGSKTLSIQNNPGSGLIPVNIALMKDGNQYTPIDISMKQGLNTLHVIENSTILTGAFKLEDNKPKEGYIARYPVSAKGSTSITRNGTVEIHTSHQYAMVTFIKMMKRKNPKYHFDESHPKILALHQGLAKDMTTINPPEDYDFAVAVGIDLLPGSSIDDLNHLDEKLSQASFQILY